MLNIASLILGFAAWILPVVAMFRKKNYSGWSFVLCAASLYMQICQTNVLVNKGDWAAIEDTHYAVTLAATVLLIVVVMLNGIAAISKRKR